MRIGLIPACAILFGLSLAGPQRAVSQDASAPSVLKVNLNYTGSGTVDGTHRIYVVLWDSPDFVSGQGMPVELQPSSDKRGTVTFSNVTKVPAYVSAAYDPKGAWDGQSGPPPDGSSLGLYSKTPGKPEPIEIKPGKTAAIELSFDDSVKMQSGKPAR
ncbi:MAG: hypothetical protein M3Y57_00860 [Acidobacteriota bacterium]|nr:hypothetical protein [Acidobacteriota bacterium]